MSGFEVAGVILGSIPLIISALEHYKHSISTVRTLRNYDGELRSLIWNLETERVRFQDVCEKLLIGLVPSSQIDFMVNNPFDPAWNEDPIQEKFKSRLWRSFCVFEEIFKDMEEAIQKMMKRLDLQPDGTIKWKKASSVLREFKCASFVLRRSAHARQLATIKDGVGILESLIGRNVHMEPERHLRCQGRFMGLVRDISGSTYRALRSGFQCNCEHEMHLGLVSRSVKMGQKDDDEDIIQKLYFQLALTYREEVEETMQPHERVSRTEVLIRALPCRTEHNLRSTGMPPQRQKSNGEKRKRVSISPFQSSATTTTGTERTSASTMVIQQPFSELSTNSISPKFNGQINICESIRQSQNHLEFDCYGMITDNTLQTSREFGVYSTRSSSNRDNWSVVSLREILELPLSCMPVPAKLHLATMISSSFLQLHQTPWLPNMFTSHDIFFLKKGPKMQYEHAFVMRKFPERLQESQDNNEYVPSNGSPALLSLGILLLELGLGRTIDSLRVQSEENSDGVPNLMDELVAAQSLLRQDSLLSLNYIDVVQLCIWGDFGGPKPDLNDEDFLQEVYVRVVASLETGLRNATWSHRRAN
ncbi:uncharacterized protein CTRU02_203961 [Colletotrichum truncatum]|uniref:Uncharacterized protein n=1 Tax=Colletotrichum truncatum TaxID=5467 RepID=A0ACC3ZAR9_COLTU|nr:uncharacterized protein CTRU02_15442 [Colletotrichum truncatum]KAF6781041.1 hypothetical protein CTRU02_15442 [Colletotrichum truncatum]